LDADTGADTGPEEDAADTGPDAAPDDSLCVDEADCNTCCEDNHVSSQATLETIHTTCGCLSPDGDPLCPEVCDVNCTSLTAPAEESACTLCLIDQVADTAVAACTAAITACGDDCKKLNACLNTCPAR
jgi:hypothetical protein